MSDARALCQPGGWLDSVDDLDALAVRFVDPPAPYRPVPLWWWSGEPLERDRLMWQLEQFAALGCGGVCVIHLAPFRACYGTAADLPAALSPAWIELFRAVCERAKQLHLGVFVGSPLLAGGPVEIHRIIETSPALAAWTTPVSGEPCGLDYGNPAVIDALTGPDSVGGRLLEAIDDLLGDPVVGIFEDEFPVMVPWSAGLAAAVEHRTRAPFDPDRLDRDCAHDPGAPAYRWLVCDSAAQRVSDAYGRWQHELVTRHALVGAFDQMCRRPDPRITSVAYLDPFRTLSWASAPGTDQMGDARFARSLANVRGGRVALEGFHSHGWGHRLAEQAAAVAEWGREGASMFFPHGGYYSTRGLWWEWAPPETFWRQPYARHYPSFASWVGRTMLALSAGRHDPEVSVLMPTSTVWATTRSDRSIGPEGVQAAETYVALNGIHDAPSILDPSAVAIPGLLRRAGYDSATVDEMHLDAAAGVLIVPACMCLRTATLRRLVALAHEQPVIVIEPVPAWSAERGAADAEFEALARELAMAAIVVSDAAAAIEALAAARGPRVEGLAAQWRRLDDADVVFLAGTGTARIGGAAGRRATVLDPATGARRPACATIDGDTLVVDANGPATILVLDQAGVPAIAPLATASPPSPRCTIELGLDWRCAYLPWADNRWGDLRLPPSPTLAIERRTFAHREGDVDGAALAPVVPEDVEWSVDPVGFRELMLGATARVAPSERDLGGGWREVVATFGPRATLDGRRAVEYSERYGVEDLTLSTHLGLKGAVEPVKVDLGAGGGRMVTHGYVARSGDTHFVVEGNGVVALSVDARPLTGGVELGVVSVPLQLQAGWHEFVLEVSRRDTAPTPYARYVPPRNTRVAWAVTAPYQREAQSIWGSPLFHPDYKGGPGPRRFRRRVRLDRPARVSIEVRASGPVEALHGEFLAAGEQVLEYRVGPSAGLPHFVARARLFTDAYSVELVTDTCWETAADGGEWEAAYSMSLATGCVPDIEPVPRRSPLLDVAWLEGDDAVGDHVATRWAAQPAVSPPAWFCFRAPPGARSMTMAVLGDVRAWSAGRPVDVERLGDGTVRVALVEGERVAMRVQPPPGVRGAACFERHPEIELGPGTIRVGESWHRLGLDCFAGVIVHRADVELAAPARASLELGDVAGSVTVVVNGMECAVLFCPPWTAVVELRQGRNEIELLVANTLAPLVARGVPTSFAPEEQRRSGLLERPRLYLLDAEA